MMTPDGTRGGTVRDSGSMVIKIVAISLREMSPVRCMLHFQDRPPFSNSADEVVLGIGPEFRLQWAGCKGTSRRSRAATLKIVGANQASCSLSPRKTRNTRKNRIEVTLTHAAFSCVSCLSWLTQLHYECIQLRRTRMSIVQSPKAQRKKSDRDDINHHR